MGKYNAVHIFNGFGTTDRVINPTEWTALDFGTEVLGSIPGQSEKKVKRWKI